MVRKLSIFCLLLLFFSPGAFSKTGIGYFFKDKRVMKKFYSGSASHFQNNVASRIYKSENLSFKPGDFNIKTKAIREWTKFFIDIKVLKSRHINPVHQKILNLTAFFQSPYHMYVDLYPKKETQLPKWAKSLDFMILGSEPSVQINLYFEYPNGLKMRFQLPLKKRSGWQKKYLNLFHGNKRDYYRNKPIKLTKIRLMKTLSQSPANFTVFLTNFRVYNYRKNYQNQFLDPYDVFADFEKGHPRHWKYTVDNKKISNNIAQIVDHENDYLIWENNKKYLALSVPPEVHKNKPLLIHLPVRFYKLKKQHHISFWIKGNGKGEEVSAIFQEGKWRYFELVITEINFVGWKKITVRIPKDEIVYLNNSFNQQKFINLIGLKISNSVQDIPINVGFDQIEGVIIPQYLGDPKEL